MRALQRLAVHALFYDRLYLLDSGVLRQLFQQQNSWSTQAMAEGKWVTAASLLRCYVLPALMVVLLQSRWRS
jgi:hypothetical protein